MDDEMTPEERLDIDLETLRIWAEKNATSRSARFDEEATAAQIVLELLDGDRIGHEA